MAKSGRSLPVFLQACYISPFQDQGSLEFTRFSIDISIVLGLDSCVTKAKWKKWEEGKTVQHIRISEHQITKSPGLLSQRLEPKA
jgi:hypothetical protein